MTSLLIQSHDLTDNTCNKQVLESHSVSPASEGLCCQLLILTKSCKNSRFASEGTLFVTYLKMHILLHFVLSKCSSVDSVLVGYVALYLRTEFSAMHSKNLKTCRCTGNFLSVGYHYISVQADLCRAQIYFFPLLMGSLPL